MYRIKEIYFYLIYYATLLITMSYLTANKIFINRTRRLLKFRTYKNLEFQILFLNFKQHSIQQLLFHDLEYNFTFLFQDFHTVSDNIYDPVFYLPLFITLLDSHNVVPCSKFIRSGALAISLVACSSEYEEIRLAAQTVITKFYFHLEGTR